MKEESNIIKPWPFVDDEVRVLNEYNGLKLPTKLISRMTEKGLEPCFNVVAVPGESTLKLYPVLDGNKSKFTVTPDNNNFVKLPDHPMKKARLNGRQEVAVLGVHDHIEILPSRKWEKEKQGTSTEEVVAYVYNILRPPG